MREKKKKGRQLFLRVAKPVFMGWGGNCNEDFSTFNSLIHQVKERARGRRKLNYRDFFVFCFVFLFYVLCLENYYRSMLLHLHEQHIVKTIT